MRLRWWTFVLPQFLAAALALLAGLWAVDRVGERAIDRQQTAIARSAADYFVAFSREEGRQALIAALDRRERAGSPDGFRYALLSAQGAPLAGRETAASVADEEEDLRPVLRRPLPGGEVLLVVEDVSARADLRRAVLSSSALALIFVAVCVGLVGLATGWMLMRRASHVAQTADRISQGDLTARVSAVEDGDAFDHLGVALNAMLTKVEELLTSLRTVTDSVAHDLRAPLTRARTALDQAEASGSKTAAAEARAQVDQALATLSALMDVARAETGLSRELMSSVDLAVLVEEVGELFAPLIEDSGQTLTISAPDVPVVARGHQALLRQACGNLLHNAAIHAGPGAQVRLELVSDDSKGVIVVSDTGQGVPVDQLGRVQERFVRADAARSTPGSGLGLAIAAACAKLHGGRLVLSDNAPGLRVQLSLPTKAGSSGELAIGG